LSQETGGAAENSAGHIRELAEESRERFIAAMEDDFNTAAALGVLYELVREVNKWSLAPGFALNTAAKKGLQEAVAVLEEGGEILGLRFGEASAAAAELGEEEIEAMLAKREEARREKNYRLADEIRDQLKERGVIIEDTPQGTRWRRG
jgi:cysteinyl-tRNA synthetase